MEDRELVRQILSEGRQRAFGEIVRRYSGMVFAKALGITRRKDTAQEIAQQTFIRAYTSLDGWHGERLGPWLAAIACHLALDLLEKERRRRTEGMEQVQAPEEPYAEEHEQRLQQMERAIALLPDADRRIIQLHYYQRMKTDEIARKLGLSTANVLVRLHRIRERLKKTMTHDTEA